MPSDRAEDVELDAAVTIEEAMELLGVSRRTVWKYLLEGKMRRLWRQAGSRTMIPIADIHEMMRPRPRKARGLSPPADNPDTPGTA